METKQTGGIDWQTWVQGALGSVVDTRLAVYKQQNMQSYEPMTGKTYTDGQPSSKIGGVSTNTLMIVGGGLLVLVAVGLLMKD